MMPSTALWTAALVALAVTPVPAIDFGDQVFVHDTKNGDTVLGATAMNDGGRDETIHVRTKDGRDVIAGKLAPGESARVTVIERPGSQPLILFDRR